MQSVADFLERAADLIEPEGRWTQDENARGKSGKPVVTNRAATSYCIMGAINVAAGRGVDSPLDKIFLGPLSAVISAQVPWAWNDAPERTQTEVVAKLREAAAKARSESL